MRIVLATTFVALGIATSCRAADPPPVSEKLLACTKLQDATERVRCYDAQMAAMRPATTVETAPVSPPPVTSLPMHASPPAAAPSSSTATPVPAPRPSAPVAASTQATSLEAQFGEETLPVNAKPEGRAEFIVSRITALRVLMPMRYEVSLANGQIWRQAAVDQISAFFHVGDQARIDRGALGAYHLTTTATGKKNWTQVIRVQ